MNKRFTATAIAALSTVAASAHAQQPMAQFIEAADAHGIDLRVAQAALDQARSQADEARARLLPGLTATGTYQRNEVQVQVMLSADRVATIQAYDQLSGAFLLSVPVLDVGAWSQFFAAEEQADAADERVDAALDDVHATVVQIWHQLVAARAVRESAQRNVDVAEQNLATIRVRVEAEVAPQLELARAEAEVARAHQLFEEADLQVVLTERNLETLTGLHPSGDAQTLDDDLHEEPPLEELMERAHEAPQVRAATHAVRAAELGVDAAWQALFPTLAATARESLTNAAGFGPSGQWAVALTATWQLDFLRPAQIGTRGAALASARAQQDLAIQQAETRIYEAWHRVRSLRARSAAARAQRDALARAVEDAHARYDAGASSQLEVIQAERDLFQAEVGRIQADADLRVAREVLGIRVGRDEE